MAQTSYRIPPTANVLVAEIKTKSSDMAVVVIPFLLSRRTFNLRCKDAILSHSNLLSEAGKVRFSSMASWQSN